MAISTHDMAASQLKPPANGVRESFTGSSTASDYVFDLDLPPAMHPPDVQAYLYCLGSPSPTMDGRDWDQGVEAGARLLQSVRDDGEG